MNLPPRTGLVLDSNAVFDAWVFADPRMQGVIAALQRQTMTWWVTASLKDEVATVIARERDARFARAAPVLWQAWDRWASVSDHPLEASELRCRDADDQKFIDLALSARARWLITRDRALLDLSRKASSRGLLIVTAQDWSADGA